MAKEFSRSKRVADQIQRDLAMLIQQEIKDPRVGLVTINAVQVSRDLNYADIYFTCMALDDNADSQKESEKVLNGAAGFLRTELSHGLRLRTTPELRFHYDSLLGEGQRMTRLISEARKTDRNLDPDDGEEA
jgi:ribosome-binding factor A